MQSFNKKHECAQTTTMSPEDVSAATWQEAGGSRRGNRVGPLRVSLRTLRDDLPDHRTQTALTAAGP